MSPMFRRRGLAVLTTAALLVTSGAAFAVAEPLDPEVAVVETEAEPEVIEPEAEPPAEPEATEPEVEPEATEPEPEVVEPEAEPETAEAEEVVEGEQVLVLTGPLRVAAYETFGRSVAHDHGDHAEHPDVTYVFFVETAEGHVPLAEEDLPADVLPGEGLTVTITAPAGEKAAEVVEALGADDSLTTVVDVAAFAAATDPDAPLAAASAPALTGTRNIVVLPVHWSGTPQDATKSQLTAMAVGTKAYWERTSNGRLTLNASVRDSKAISSGSCSLPAMESAALAAHGVTKSANTHYMVYMPEYGCGWLGMGWIGDTGLLIHGVTDIDTAAHELGHNFGLGHANLLDCDDRTWRSNPIDQNGNAGNCWVEEYADEADVMGFGHPGSAWGNSPGNINMASATFLGWTSLREISSLQHGSTANVLAVQNYTGLRALRAPTSHGNLYLEYRPNRAPDTFMSDWSGVQVRLGKNTYYGFTTYLLDLQPTVHDAWGYSHHRPQLSLNASWTIPGTSDRLKVSAQNNTQASLQFIDGDAPRIERYVKKVYQDLFKRAPDEAGLRNWTVALLNGTPRVAVANSITSSTEYRSRLINASYQRFLGRPADAAGLQNWLKAMRGGYTVQQMEAGFIASQEYFNKAGGTNSGWVRKLYQHVLNRQPNPGDVNHWVRQLNQGATRRSVAMGFLMSTENLTTVVDGYYQELLGRRIDASGRVAWVKRLQSGGRVEQIIGGIVSSQEYWNKT